MKIIKTILNIILSFSLIIIIIATILTNILTNKILNKEYVISKMEETQVYAQISREVQSGFKNYIYQSGLPEDTIEDLYSEELLKNDVNSIIDYIYDGTNIKISNEEVQKSLETKIDQYIESQDIKLNNQGKANIKKFENLIINEYENNINVSNELYEKANKGIQKLKDINNKIEKIPMIVLIVNIVLLVIINIKNLLVAINYIGISLLSTGILINIGTDLVIKNIDFDNLLIFAKSISSLIVAIIKDCLYGMQDNASLFIMAGGVAIIITAILRNIGKSEN